MFRRNVTGMSLWSPSPTLIALLNHFTLVSKHAAYCCRDLVVPLSRFVSDIMTT